MNTYETTVMQKSCNRAKARQIGTKGIQRAAVLLAATKTGYGHQPHVLMRQEFSWVTPLKIRKCNLPCRACFSGQACRNNAQSHGLRYKPRKNPNAAASHHLNTNKKKTRLASSGDLQWSIESTLPQRELTQAQTCGQTCYILTTSQHIQS